MDTVRVVWNYTVVYVDIFYQGCQKFRGNNDLLDIAVTNCKIIFQFHQLVL